MPLYSLESWKPTQQIVIKLRVFTHRCLRIILGVTLPQKITNFAVGNICKKEDIIVGATQVKWTRIGLRHVLEKTPATLLEKVCFGHQKGRQRARHKKLEEVSRERTWIHMPDLGQNPKDGLRPLTLERDWRTYACHSTMRTDDE